MAATKGKLTKGQQEQTRLAIKTTQLVKRLQFYALGEIDPAHKAKDGEEAKPVELDSGKLKAIEILLRKALPDLQAVTVSGDSENPIVSVIERRIVKADN